MLAHNRKVKSICIGAAGPINNRSCKLTNSSLTIDANHIAFQTKRQVYLLNDLEVLGYGLNVARKKDLHVIKAGNSVRKGTKIILSVGTGLGKSILVSFNDSYVPLPSEGGHADLPLTKKEMNLIEKKVTSEDVLSGKGLVFLYKLFKKSSDKKITPEQVIQSHRIDPAARDAVSLFCTLLCRCAKNFALDTLALNGIYFAGGVITNNTSVLCRKITLSLTSEQKKTLENVPMYIIKNSVLGALGACYYAGLTEQF